jgi:hypothetical protein
VGPWALARMARSILMEPRALPGIQDTDTAARAGPEIVAERVGPALNFLPLAISLRDEVVSEVATRRLRPLDSDLVVPAPFPLQFAVDSDNRGFTGARAMLTRE